jgi:subtilisin family serine protease
MSEKEYIVTLKAGVNYEAFNTEMIASTGAGNIPGRSVGVVNPRPGSTRNTHYALTDEEAQTVANDDRVVAVEIPPEHRDDIEIGLNATQDANFTKTTSDSGTFVNWGLRRCITPTNPYDGSDPVNNNYDYTLDGNGVDVVIQDSGIEPGHPEWNDKDGVPRLQQIDWYAESGLSGTQSPNHYRDFDGHGTHCAGIAAGLNYGWAKGARIYSVKVAGLEGTGDSGTGISISDVFDVITGWHNNKPVDPVTGLKRPTIVNMSWGYGTTFTNFSGGSYRGDAFSATTRTTSLGMIGAFTLSGYRFGVRIPSVDADVEQMIEAGIHVCIAAGNSRQRVSIPGDVDYNNFINKSGTVYYHRGGSPFSSNAFMTGNIDSNDNLGTQEQKVSSSECGPGVNIYAPGTNIMSATSITNKFNGQTYPFETDSDYKICNIGGTSMAAPQVAGLGACILQLNPSYTPEQLQTFVFDNSSKGLLNESNNQYDYTNSNAILGSVNRYLFQPFNNPYVLQIKNT